MQQISSSSDRPNHCQDNSGLAGPRILAAGAAQILRNCFAEEFAAPWLAAALREVLVLQADPQIFGEVGGRLEHKQGRLIFDLIQPGLDCYAYKQWCQLQDTYDRSAACYLAAELDRYLSEVTIDSEAVSSKLNKARDFLERIAGGDLAEALEQECYFPSIREVLESSYKISPEEMRVEEPGFVGIFHVHKNGEPPNDADVRWHLRQGLTGLVLVPAVEAPTEVVAVHLVDAGQAALLWRGRFVGV